jgi:hypothetical protein
LKRFLKIYVRRKAFVAVGYCSRWKGQPGLLMAKRPAFLQQKEFSYITKQVATKKSSGNKGQTGLLVAKRPAFLQQKK